MSAILVTCCLRDFVRVAGSRSYFRIWHSYPRDVTGPLSLSGSTWLGPKPGVTGLFALTKTWTLQMSGFLEKGDVKVLKWQSGTTAASVETCWNKKNEIRAQTDMYINYPKDTDWNETANIAFRIRKIVKSRKDLPSSLLYGGHGCRSYNEKHLTNGRFMYPLITADWWHQNPYKLYVSDLPWLQSTDFTQSGYPDIIYHRRSFKM